MRMKSELNGNIRLIDWGRIGGFKKKLLVGNQRLFNLKNYFGGFLGVLKSHSKTKIEQMFWCLFSTREKRVIAFIHFNS
jgi:hypothetical protein